MKQTNKQQTLGGPILPTFPYGGLPLEFKNFSLTILPLTKQLNFYDKTHKCSLAVELTTSELALFEWFVNTLVEVAQTTGPQDVAAD